MLGRNVKHLATGTDGKTAAIGGQAATGQVVLDLALLLAGKVVLAVKIDGNLLATLCCGVKHIEVTTVLKHNLAAATVGELHVIFGEVGHLLGSTSAGVIDKDVHAVVAVAHVVDFVANPHGINVLGNIIGDVGHRLGLGVINPDVVGHPALVVFPCAELAEHAVVSQLGSISIIAAETAFGQWQLL